MPTKQETFDAVAQHLRTQGKKCENNEYCLYRGKNGLKCAAGCLIPDDRYSSKFEEDPVFWKNRNEITEVGLVIIDLGHDLNLVSDLQRVHDALEVEDWEYGLQKVARNHGLEYAMPQAHA